MGRGRLVLAHRKRRYWMNRQGRGIARNLPAGVLPQLFRHSRIMSISPADYEKLGQYFTRGNDFATLTPECLRELDK